MQSDRATEPLSPWFYALVIGIILAVLWCVGATVLAFTYDPEPELNAFYDVAGMVAFMVLVFGLGHLLVKVVDRVVGLQAKG